MKKYFKVSTATVVASGLGAAIFTLLFMFVKIPSPIPQTSFQTAYGFAGFIAAIYGPIAAGLSAFIGHAISDALQYGSPWWSWVIAMVWLVLSLDFLTKTHASKRENSKERISLNSIYSKSSVMP